MCMNSVQNALGSPFLWGLIYVVWKAWSGGARLSGPLQGTGYLLAYKLV
jgi:hypothetical protein